MLGLDFVSHVIAIGVFAQAPDGHGSSPESLLAFLIVKDQSGRVEFHAQLYWRQWLLLTHLRIENHISDDITQR